MITVICILYNSDHLITNFLSQFKKNKNINEIIFFDNSKKINQSINAYAKIIGTGENLGYGSAINKAVSYAKSEWILVANPDILIHDNTLDLVKLSKETLYAPVQILNNKKIYGYEFPNLLSDALLLSFFRYLKPLKKFFERKKITSSTNMPKKWYQSGALILIPKIFFEKYGGFDEKYFMFYEELDLYDKAINKGFKIDIGSFLTFQNFQNSSENDVSPIKGYAEMDSFKKYYKKKLGLVIIVNLMKFIITFHFIIIKIISKIIKNKKIFSRLEFLRNQIRALKKYIIKD